MSNPLPEARFERFELHNELGRGGMAVVYAAFDCTRRTMVALKCLSSERFSVGKARDRAVAMFEREYYALSQLTHPHIIQVYDYGIDGEGPYYTMERLTGESLRTQAPRPWAQVCALGRDIASALALLHSRSLVHRDVTPLNIHCTADARAKLIDFGAMMPAGLARHLVGTPAFIAPEAMQQQSLDGRADLFALGACLYFAITGRHAYPARSLDSLHDVWQTPPQRLSALASDVPEALDELIFALLNLERDDRPRTAAEVYERLTAVANLPREEAAATRQAYLTRPSLVGRDTQLEVFRQRARSSLAETGCALLVRGARGLGRSRLLDAAALEATLCGFQVARADAAGGQASSLAAACQLLGALVVTNPAITRTLDALGLRTLVTEGLPAGLDAEKRQSTLEALIGILLEGCKQQPLALIVDDVHAIDEPSLALLASLSAQASKQRLLIVCSIDRDFKPEKGSAAALLTHLSRRVDVSPLDAEQSRELLASLFDDVLHIDLLAAVAYRHCQGNPRRLLEAAQRLIDLDLARYEAGTWLIASAPEALSAAIEDTRDVERLLGFLSEDARELIEVVAFDRYSVLDLASYPALLNHGHSARMHRALSDLVDTHWVELYEDRIRLLHDDCRSAILVLLAEGRRQELHARLAARCVELALPAVYEAHHRLGAGETARAVAALDRYDEFVNQHPTAEVLRHPITLETTEAVANLRDVPGAHPAMSAKYLSATALNGTYRTLAEFTAQRLPTALAALAPFSGTRDYAALTHLSPNERLTQALTAASERCNQPGLGAMDILSALRRQTQLSVATAVIANFMSDARLLQAVPDLTPFRILSPALDSAAQVIDALSKLARGQTWLAWDALRETQRELRGPAAAQLDALTRMVLERVVLGYVSEINSNFGTSTAHALTDAYASQMPDLAASHRTLVCLAHGNLSGAAEARRRFEVLSVLTGALANARIIELPAHLTVHTLCGDVIGLRRTHRMLQDVARTRPGWQPRVELAHAQLLRWRGELDESVRVLERLLSQLVPPHADWQLAAASHLSVLVAAKRGAQAIELGDAYLAQARAADLPDYLIACVLAQACLDTGELDHAEQHFDVAVAQLERRGAQGVLLGCAYEVGARIARARGDVAAFAARAAACGKHFQLGRHPALTARYNALTGGGAPAGRLGGDRRSLQREVLGDTSMQSLHQLAERAIDDASFYRGVLNLVLESAVAIGGILYCNQDGALRRVAQAGAVATLPDVDLIVARHCTLSDEGDEDETQSIPETQSSAKLTEHGAFGVYALECDDDAGARTLAGALVLDFATVRRAALSPARLASVAAVVADWARARGSYVENSQSQGLSQQRTASSSADTISCTPGSKTDRE